MAKKILLIENDPTFAAELAESLEATGFAARGTGDGKEGLDLARAWGPDAIVLCVELPGMSGYLVCQKLKKDDGLKGVPLVLTSAEATEETFEKHRTLKARADEYLLKPFTAAALLEKLDALIGLPEGPPSGSDAERDDPVEEELVTLEEEIGFDVGTDSPEAEIPGLDLDSLPDEPAIDAPGGREDDDLRLLDDAFDGLAAPRAAADAAAALDELTDERPVGMEELDAATASLPGDDDLALAADLGDVGADAEAALGALAPDDDALDLAPPLDLEAENEVALEPRASKSPVRGASADLLRAAGIKLLDDSPGGPPAAALGSPRNTAVLSTASERSGRGGRFEREPPDLYDPGVHLGREELADAREALDRVQGELAERDASSRELERKVRDLADRAEDAEADAGRARAQAEAAVAQARKAEAEARAAREDARRAADQARSAQAELSELRRRLADAERRAEDEARIRAADAAAAADAVARSEALEREADELRTELLVARGEAEGARGEIERRTSELRKRLAEIEAANAKNEERILKAYQKIKGDEKAREKVRKALAIAAQLLEEGLQPDSAAERERRAAAAAALAGREQ
jgi:CheY-like chemotaxis protein